MAETSGIDDTFATRLNLALKALNFSRGQLASAVGVDKSLISRWLSGQVVPTSHNLARISDTIAKLKPGFNMTLWERPLSEFESFFGLVPSAPLVFADSAGLIVAHPPRSPAPARWMSLGALAGLVVIGTVAVYALIAPSRTAPAAAPRPVVAVVPDTAPNSIAVLPFVNMSGDAANDYFSDGISEEILNELANTPSLRVVARTSSFAFKGTRAGIADIGRRLNVRAVLEGSVREEGNRVRITAQLVNAADGFHIWSQTYDRDLGDMLKVQSEIARAIAQALTQKITTTPAPDRPIAAEAYRKYLQAKAGFDRRDEAATNAAIRLLDEATVIQPDFAEAHAMKALALMNRTYNFIYRADAVTLAHIDSEIKQALASDPRNMTALYASFHRAVYAMDWNRAAVLVAQMREISSGHVLTIRATSFLCGALGLVDCAAKQAERAARMDPISFPPWANLQVLMFVAGRNKESISAGETALALQPSVPIVTEWLCLAYLKDGQRDRARAAAAQLRADPKARTLIGCRIPLAVEEGHRDEAVRLADARASSASEDHVDFMFVAESYLDAGDDAKALAWFERSYDAREPGLYAAEYDRSLRQEFFQSAGWLALKQRPRFREWSAVRARLTPQLAAEAGRD